MTAWASSMPPAPPSAKTLLSTAANAPASSEPRLRMAVSSGVSVGKWFERDDDGQVERLYHSYEMREILHTLPDGLDVRGFEVAGPYAAVVLDGADGSDYDGSVRLQTVEARLYVHELLESEVGAESGLGQNVVSVSEREPVADDGRAAVRYVAERAGVYDDRLALGGLDYVGLDGVPEQGHHRADGADVLGGYGPAVGGAGFVRVADDYPAQPFAQVFEVAGEGEYRHNLGRGDYVESALAHRGVVGATDAGHYGAEGAVFDVGDPAPGYALGAEAVYPSALRHVVGERGEQVVGGADGVGVAGEVYVHLVLRLDEALAAAGAAALDSEYGPQRRLSERRDDVLSQPAHRLGEADRRGRLALAGGSGRYAGDDDHLAAPAALADGVQPYLCLVMTVWDNRFPVESKLLGDIHNRAHSVNLQSVAGKRARELPTCQFAPPIVA